MMLRLFNFISKRPKKILIAAAVLTAFFIVLLLGSDIKTNLYDYIAQKYIGNFDYVKENFDERNILSLTIEATNDQSVISVPLLHEQDRFFTEVESRWPVEVNSLTKTLNKHIGKSKKEDGTPYTIQDIQNQHIVSDIVVSLYMDDPYEFERLIRKALSDKEGLGYLQELFVFTHIVGGIPPGVKFNFPKVSALRATISTKEDMSRVERREIFQGIRELSEDFSPDFTIRLYSFELAEIDVDEKVLINSPFVIGFMILLLAAVLFITFRSVFFTLVPIAILSLMVLWSFGIASAVGIKNFSFIHIIAIPLLLGQCIDNLIHFNERFREEYGRLDKKEAVKVVFSTAGKAAGLTTFLNMVAFSADIFSTNITPVQEYAFIIVLGLGIALVLSYIIGGAIVLLTKVKVAPQRVKSAEEGSKRAKSLFDFIQKNKIILLVVSFTIFGLMLFKASYTDLNFRVTSFMSESAPTYQAHKFEREKFSLYLPHYVILRGNIATQTAIDAITKIEETLTEIEDVEHIHNKSNTESINYLLSKFYRDEIPENLAEVYSEIKESDKIINPIALLTAKEVAPKIIKEEDGEFTATLIKFWPEENFSFEIKSIADKIDKAAEPFKPDLSVSTTGHFLEFSRTMDEIVISSIVAMFVTLAIIILLLWRAYRRLRTSLFAVIPLFFGVVCGVGMLPILNVELNALNGTIGVLALGLGVDYAIQIMNRYHEELTKQETPAQAMRECFGHMVVPLGQCVLLTSAGLFVLMGILPITGKFGIAAAVSLLTGYLAAVFIMPIFAVRFIRTVPESLRKKYKAQ